MKVIKRNTIPLSKLLYMKMMQYVLNRGGDQHKKICSLINDISENFDEIPIE